MAIENRDSSNGKFLPGHGGGPGRPLGSRNKLANEFIADLHQFWLEEGSEVIRAAARERPADVLRVIASILPRDIKVSLETMTDKDLSTRIDQLTESLGLKLVPVGTAVSHSAETVELEPSTRKN